MAFAEKKVEPVAAKKELSASEKTKQMARGGPDIVNSVKPAKGSFVQGNWVLKA